MSERQNDLKCEVEGGEQMINDPELNEDLDCLLERLREMGIAAVYKTQIQFGGPDAEWHDDADLILVVKNRNEIVPACASPNVGTTVTWSSTDGNGSITFFDEGEFRGSAQFPNEGPVGYRGELK